MHYVAPTPMQSQARWAKGSRGRVGLHFLRVEVGVSWGLGGPGASALELELDLLAVVVGVKEEHPGAGVI